MSGFHFFTNLTSLQTQTVQRYGPVQGNEASEYRVTSLFSSPNVQKAYAVCNGKIFAQEVNGKINIALQPTQQPTDTSAPVKYYVYKGLLKTFLVDGDNVHIADSAKSALTSKIRESQIKRNAAYDALTGSTTTTLPSINSVGLNLTASATDPNKLLDTDFLDAAFLRLNQDEFQSVDGGDDIGQFDANFGFEVILDGLGEGPSLKALRNAETVITANPVPAGDVNEFKEEDKREQVLNYIDPCAFYSTFFFTGIKVKLVPSDTKFIPKSKDGLYNEVLTKFSTRDIVYLDLRNEHNHGLNYYRNYNVLPNKYAQFYIKHDGGSSALVEYQSSGWPILVIPISAFTNTDAKKPSTIVLNLPQGDNPEPMIYRTQGYFFSGFKRMNQPPDVKEVLRVSISFQPDTFTEPIEFSIPKLANNATIPFYVGARYLKKIGSVVVPNPPVGSIALKAEHFLDNLFELTSLVDDNGLKIPINTDEITQWHVTGSTAVVDSTSRNGGAYPAKIGIGSDENNISFFACTEPVNITTGSTSQPSLLPVLIEAHKSNIEFGRIEILDGNNVPQPMLIHNGLPDGILDPSFDSTPINVDESSLILLVIDKDELPLIQNAIRSLAPSFDKRLVLRNKTDYLDSNGNVMAREYDLRVIGYQFGSGVSIASANPGIKIRHERFTPRLFSSADAARNTELLDPVTENRKHFINSKIAKGTTARLRSEPASNANLLCETQGGEHRIKILGKKKDPTVAMRRVWYYIELRDPIVVTDPETKTSTILPTGTKAWTVDSYPVSTFENFIKDLIAMNGTIDNDQAVPESLVERITRLRQATKEADIISTLFDAMIGATATPPPAEVRLHDPANYVTGPIVEFESVPALETKIQLFEDYMGVTMGKGQIIDLHHLFIGMDGVNHPNDNTEVVFALLDWYLGSNINAITWAGDIGAIPGDFLVLPDDAEAPRPLSKGIDWRYQNYWRRNHPDATPEETRTAFLDHYWETRAKDEDLLPDVYCHLLRERLLKYVTQNPEHRKLEALLYHFNVELANEKDVHAFQVFARYLGLNPSSSLPYVNYPTIAESMKTDIYQFAVLWYYNKFHLPVLGDNDELKELSKRFTTRFLMWLDGHR